MSLRDDLFSNNKKGDYLSSLKANEVNVPLVTPPVYGVTAPKATPILTSFPVQPEQTIAERNRNGENIFSILQSYNKPYDFEAEMKQAERARKGALFTDVVGLAGDALTSLMGRRQFAKTVPNTAIANARIEKLKDLKRRYDVDYNNKRLDAAYRQFMLDRDDKRYNDSRRREDERYQDSQKWRENQFNYQKERANIQDKHWQEQQNIQERRLGLQQTTAASQQEYNKLKAEATRLNTLARMENLKSQHTKDYDYFFGEGGRKSIVPKSMKKALAGYLYGRMQQIVSIGDSKGRTVEDVKMQFGEGGDQSGKMTAIVDRRLREFPELQDELDMIVGNTKASPSLLPQSSTQQSKSTGSLLPK